MICFGTFVYVLSELSLLIDYMNYCSYLSRKNLSLETGCMSALSLFYLLRCFITQLLLHLLNCGWHNWVLHMLNKDKQMRWTVNMSHNQMKPLWHCEFWNNKARRTSGLSQPTLNNTDWLSWKHFPLVIQKLFVYFHLELRVIDCFTEWSSPFVVFSSHCTHVKNDLLPLLNIIIIIFFTDYWSSVWIKKITHFL